MVSSYPSQSCLVVLLLAFWLIPSFAFGSSGTSALCEYASKQASQRTGVPLEVLRAISLTESGTKRDGQFGPWPWTVNMSGDGRWFDNRQAALEFVERHFSSGSRNFDVGCFQINYRWHHSGFRSTEEMFEPMANAMYAAQFLKSLYLEFGDWTKAAGAFHSRTPKFAKRYITRYNRIRESLSGQTPTYVEPTILSANQESKTNSFPFLKSAAVKEGNASLVPLLEIAETGRFIAFMDQ